MSLSILVVGGCGYIGSHMVKLLVRNNFKVTVLDNLSTSTDESLFPGAKFVVGDMGDNGLVSRICSENHFDAVIHFASFSSVAESTGDPGKYFANNVSKTISFLDALRNYKIEKVIFSSSAAIYGAVENGRINEIDPKIPISPYGRSKLMIEEILGDYSRAYDLRSVSLRYFNAAGADPEGELGEKHEPETHLIPIVLECAAGIRDKVKVFGTDYSTPDGSCIRDYVHVCDLCSGHLAALNYLMDGGNTRAFNLGSGSGSSVLEVIRAAEKITGKEIEVFSEARRIGDPPILVADIGLAKRILGWAPVMSDIETIISHAWNWQVNGPRHKI